jgi:hypothetical protein
MCGLVHHAEVCAIGPRREQMYENIALNAFIKRSSADRNKGYIRMTNAALIQTFWPIKYKETRPHRTLALMEHGPSTVVLSPVAAVGSELDALHLRWRCVVAT